MFLVFSSFLERILTKLKLLFTLFHFYAFFGEGCPLWICFKAFVLLIVFAREPTFCCFGTSAELVMSARKGGES